MTHSPLYEHASHNLTAKVADRQGCFPTSQNNTNTHPIRPNNIPPEREHIHLDAQSCVAVLVVGASLGQSAHSNQCSR